MTLALVLGSVAVLLLLDALTLLGLVAVFDLDDRGVNRAGVAIVVATAAAAGLVVPVMVNAVTSLIG